jgi:L-iditol 2-dehydrogenase
LLAAVYYNNADIRITELPQPEINADELLVKVMACGICGSDVTEWYRLPSSPRVLGHEATGIVEEIGKNITKYNIGDRVFVSHHVPCNNCRYCLNGHHTACETLHTTNYFPGGFSQYIRVQKIIVNSGIYKLPFNMSYADGTFIEPLGCIVRGQRLASIDKDDTVLIIGSGISGILHIQLAKLTGVRKIVAADINPHRLKLAIHFGAHSVINARTGIQRTLRKENNGRLADRVIICTGARQAVSSAIQCVDRGGRILFFAVPPPTVKVSIPITEFWKNEITVMTSYGAAPSDLKEALRILAQKRINVTDMITHKFSLREISKGFKLVSNPENSLKIIIQPNRVPSPSVSS